MWNWDAGTGPSPLLWNLRESSFEALLDTGQVITWLRPEYRGYSWLEQVASCNTGRGYNSYITRAASRLSCEGVTGLNVNTELRWGLSEELCKRDVNENCVKCWAQWIWADARYGSTAQWLPRLAVWKGSVAGTLSMWVERVELERMSPLLLTVSTHLHRHTQLQPLYTVWTPSPPEHGLWTGLLHAAARPRHRPVADVEQAAYSHSEYLLVLCSHTQFA